MKRVFILSTILMIAGAMNAWAAACAEGAAGKYGAITIATVDGNCVATLDPDDTTSVNIPNDVTIDQFVYDRDFGTKELNPWSDGTAMSGRGLLTICLPFSGQIKSGTGLVYKIMNISKLDWGKIVWQIEAREEGGTFETGKPYFVRSFSNLIPFEKIDNETPMVMNTSSLGTTTFGDNDEWEFRGTYNYKKWEAKDSLEAKHVYGFVANDTNTASGSFKAGQFVRIKAGAFIKPMRAYLYYNKKSTNAGRPAANGVKGFAAIDDEDLPNTIEVVFQDKNGETTSIAQMNTVTGEFTSVTGWYDMKGRKLDKKPTQKGTYFNNGKKVVIK